jgi:hypothetical protein
VNDQEIDQLKPGEQIYKWWDTGAFGVDQQIMTVVRVNRRTVTVLYRGEKGRVRREDINGRWIE